MERPNDLPLFFDELTWPEAAALPRSLPLVLPLGSGYKLQELDLWGEPFALLPWLPYGWKSSPVEVPDQIFEQLVGDLFGNLMEDGFQNLYLLHPDPLPFEIKGVQSLLKPALSAPPALPELDQGRVILIPLGHTEQHGYHLPLNTDSVIIEAIAQGACTSRPGAAAALPTFPYGVSTFRDTFAGTFSLGARTYEDFLLAVIGELYGAGADRFYLLNGHGGNHSFLVNVVKFAGERYPGAFTATAWLHTSGEIGRGALEQHRRSKRGGMGHAGELETALMLHLRPDLVHMDRVVDETDFIASEHYYMDWVEGGELIANPPWTDDTQTGAYGAGSLATAENGGIWLEAAIEEKLAHLRSIHQQQDRRLARRSR